MKVACVPSVWLSTVMVFCYMVTKTSCSIHSLAKWLPCWKLQGFLKQPSGTRFTIRAYFSCGVQSTELHYWLWAGTGPHKNAYVLQTSQCKWIKPCSCLEADVALCCNQLTCGMTSLTPLTRALCVEWSHFPSLLRFVLVWGPDAVNLTLHLAVHWICLCPPPRHISWRRLIVHM